jgi:glycosidase
MPKSFHGSKKLRNIGILHPIMIRSFFLALSGLFLAGLPVSLPAGPITISRLEPLHWWTGMKDPNLQLLIYGTNAGTCSFSLLPGQKGIRVMGTRKTGNPNYLFADLRIEPGARAGTYRFALSRGQEKKIFSYLLKSHSEKAPGAGGYNPGDVVYLIMPDRFANGDTTNDQPPEMNEGLSRNEPFGRHGGDLMGIEKNMGYIQDLGMTALWLNPILENNQPHSSYHGYAITDFYRVDPRLGTLTDYKRLITDCHRRGMKMVQDMVANHIGSKHWWMDDLPSEDWIHPVGNPFNRCNFRIETLADPHASAADRKKMLAGWFDIHMPDLNQRNPLVARYLIQNTLWWIAETGIDGIRMDTYPYNYADFMTSWCEAVLKEFPRFSLVGEIWVDQPSLASYFLKGTRNRDGYKPGLPTVTDFPLYQGLVKGLGEEGSWDKGLFRVYQALMQDFLYSDPSGHLIFLDNHDLTRFLTAQNGDIARLRQGIAMLLTLRGVPQWYYGTEILMSGDGASHPEVRKDFPGGWPGDTANAFTPAGRKPETENVFRFCRKILQWRKTAPALKNGTFTQYLPEKNIYTYFRSHPDQELMVVVNGNDSSSVLELSRFRERNAPFERATDVLTDTEWPLNKSEWELPPRAVLILDLSKPRRENPGKTQK